MKFLVTKQWHALLSFCLVLLCLPQGADAQIALTAAAPNYTQNFDTYQGSSSNMGITGWTVSCPNYRGRGNGSSNSGGVWAYGTGSDWSAGYLGSGTSASINYTASFVNNMGSAITSLTIAYDFEEWRAGCGNTNGWTVTGSGALAGRNLSGLNTNSACRSGGASTPKTITLTGLQIASGATFAISWACGDGAGNDNGIAIDNFSITAVASTPSCGTIVAGTVTSNNGANFCDSSDNSILKLQGTSPVSNVSYQWKMSTDNISWANVGINANTLHTGVLRADAYYKCVVSCTSGSEKDSTVVFPITITQSVAPEVTITSNAVYPICEGTVVDFTATIQNGGLQPRLIWFDGTDSIGEGLGLIYTSAGTGAAISCVLISNAACLLNPADTSSVIQLVVTPLVTPTISISSNASASLCANTQVDYTLSTTHEGPSPVYTWRSGTIVIGNQSTLSYTPVDGEEITCELVSNAACATQDTAWSNIIHHSVVAPFSPVVSIVSNAAAPIICVNTLVTYTATGINGGAAPEYTWTNGTTVLGTGPVLQYVPSNGESIVCSLRSNAPCASPSEVISNAVTLQVDQYVTPTVNAMAIIPSPHCAGMSVQLDATGTHEGSQPYYVWTIGANVIGTGTSLSFIPVDGDVIVCSLTTNEVCATQHTVSSTPITINTLPLATPGISIANASGQVICEGSHVVLEATGTDWGTAPAFEWRSGSSVIGTTQNINYIPVNGASVNCTVTSNAACLDTNKAESNSIVMAVTPLPTVAIAANDTVTYCDNDILNLRTQHNHDTYQWYYNGQAISGEINNAVLPVAPGYYSLEGTENGCSQMSDSVLVRIISTPVVQIVRNGNILTVPNVYSSYQWLLNGTPIPNATSYMHTATLNGIYTVEVTTDGACTTTAVPVTIQNVGIPTVHIDAVRIYPNPVNNILYIDYKSLVNVSVSTVNGSTVSTGTGVNAVDISALPNGVYFVKIYSADMQLLSVNKIIKQ